MIKTGHLLDGGSTLCAYSLYYVRSAVDKVV